MDGPKIIKRLLISGRIRKEKKVRGRYDCGGILRDVMLLALNIEEGGHEPRNVASL